MWDFWVLCVWRTVQWTVSATCRGPTPSWWSTASTTWRALKAASHTCGPSPCTTRPSGLKLPSSCWGTSWTWTDTGWYLCVCVCVVVCVINCRLVCVSCFRNRVCQLCLKIFYWSWSLFFSAATQEQLLCELGCNTVLKHLITIEGIEEECFLCFYLLFKKLFTQKYKYLSLPTQLHADRVRLTFLFKVLELCMQNVLKYSSSQAGEPVWWWDSGISVWLFVLRGVRLSGFCLRPARLLWGGEGDKAGKGPQP